MKGLYREACQASHDKTPAGGMTFPAALDSNRLGVELEIDRRDGLSYV
jgi:hypothetical protein